MPPYEGVEALRHHLLPSLRTRGAKWITLNGLGAGDPRMHGALQTSLRCIGFYGETGQSCPEIVVLD